MWFNPSTSAWEALPTTVDSNARTVSAKITHASVYALFRAGTPAAPVETESVTTVATPAATPIITGLPIDLILKIVIIVIIVVAAIYVALYFVRKKKGQEPEEAAPPEDWDIKGLQ